MLTEIARCPGGERWIPHLSLARDSLSRIIDNEVVARTTSTSTRRAKRRAGQNCIFFVSFGPESGTAGRVKISQRLMISTLLSKKLIFEALQGLVDPNGEVGAWAPKPKKIGIAVLSFGCAWNDSKCLLIILGGL